MQGCGADPVFPPAAQNQKDNVAFFDAQALEKVGGLIGKALDVGKGEGFFLAVVVDPDQGLFIRLLFGPGVYNVKTEVKILRHVHFIILFKILVGIKFYPRKKTV